MPDQLRMGDCTSRAAKTTSESYGHIVEAFSSVAIGNPERHMRKASHCGSKQQ